MKVITVTSGAHKPERATPILGPYVTEFSRTGFFRYILEHFFPRKWRLRSIHERIMNIRGDNGKLNVTKRSKMSFSGVLVLLTGLWEDIRNSRENRSKNKLVSENAVTRVYGRCSPGLLAPVTSVRIDFM